VEVGSVVLSFGRGGRKKGEKGDDLLTKASCEAAVQLFAFWEEKKGKRERAEE